MVTICSWNQTFKDALQVIPIPTLQRSIHELYSIIVLYDASSFLDEAQAPSLRRSGALVRLTSKVAAAVVAVVAVPLVVAVEKAKKIQPLLRPRLCGSLWNKLC